MPHSQAKPTALDREFLALRAKLIDLAAALDRIDRAGAAAPGDPRNDTILRSLQVLSGEGPGRAEQILSLFSLPYDENWRTP